MGVIEFLGSRCSQVLMASAAMSLLVGCATMSGPVDWPEAEDRFKTPPTDTEGEPRLVRGDDGLLYAVGDFDQPPQAGQMAVGRHGQAWPLPEMDRPALFLGRVVEVFSDQVAHVHETYRFPDTDRDTLRVEFAEEPVTEDMGKGVGVIEDIDRSDAVTLELSLGTDAGVQEGDIYGVLAPYDPVRGEQTAQLTRRLTGVCTVLMVEADESVCGLRQAHLDHDWSAPIEAGQKAIFMEPRFSDAPRTARIKVGQVDGDDIDDRVRRHLEEYVSRYPGGEVTVESFDDEVEARDADFHRWNRRVNTNDPAALVGVSLQDRDGASHLVLNYTGLGTAVGPGMVAAPPEKGVDMGPVDDIDDKALRGFSAMLMGAVLVYRGQTAEALMHLHQALRDPALEGKWRWHARDQYAMRWGALDRFEEAFWLVHEDEAVASKAGDEQAYFNALGTRVRLHDFVDQHQRAYETAREYLDVRRDDRPASGYLSARAMYGEMALQNGDVETGEQVFEELVELCPDGCGGDMIPLLAGLYWAASEKSTELQDRVVAKLVELGQIRDDSSLATARMFQGWTYLRDDDQLQSLIAFLEARRLFEREESNHGIARADFYIALTQIARDEAQEGFDKAMEALEHMMNVGDYTSMVRIYERLAQIYMDIDMAGGPQPYLGAAPQVLQGALQAQLSTGDYGRAAEAGFGYGHFLFRVGNMDEARYTFQRAVLHGLRVARFDMVSLSHIFLAVIARSQGDMELFEAELDRARTMAEVADDPHIDELIEELLSPSEETEDPTQLL